MLSTAHEGRNDLLTEANGGPPRLAATRGTVFAEVVFRGAQTPGP